MWYFNSNTVSQQTATFYNSMSAARVLSSVFCPGASRSTNSSSRSQQSPQHRAQPSTQSSTSKPASYAKEEQRRWVKENVVL